MLLVRLGIVLMLFIPAQAQLADNDTMRLAGKLSLTGNFTDGNVKRYLLNTAVEIIHVQNRMGVKSSTQYMWGKFFSSKTENDILSRNFLYLDPSHRLYPFLMIWLESSVRRRVSFRNQYAAGVTFKPLYQPDHKIKTSLSLSYDNSLYTASKFINYADSSSRRISTWRIIGRVSGMHRLFQGKCKLHYEGWLQPSLQIAKNIRWHTETHIELPLNKNISFKTGITYFYDHVTVKSAKQYDWWWTTGLSIGNF